MAENKEELSIEEMFDRLDGIMRTLEDSRSTLEESFASYEAGMRLVRACSEKIDKVLSDINKKLGYDAVKKCNMTIK